MAEPIPEDVKKFIAEKINSVEQLEVLLLLRAAPDQVWNASTVSEAIYSSDAAAALRLADLQAAGLLNRIEVAPPTYRYGPVSAAVDALIARLVDVYHERRVAVITLIYSRPRDDAQAFADAFKFRKDP